MSIFIVYILLQVCNHGPNLSHLSSQVDKRYADITHSDIYIRVRLTALYIAQVSNNYIGLYVTGLQGDGRRATWPQGHRVTGPQGHRAAGSQRHKAAGSQVCRATGLQVHGATGSSTNQRKAFPYFVC